MNSTVSSDAEQQKGGEEDTKESHDGRAEQRRAQWVGSGSCARGVSDVVGSSLDFGPLIHPISEGWAAGREQRLLN